MLSSFLKKLLFARQFYMTNGKIEVLGKKQVMLPSDFILELQRLEPELAYNAVKKVMMNDIKDYAAKLGTNSESMLKNIDDIFETFGLGKLEIINLDNKKKTCIVRVHNSPLIVNKKSEHNFEITSAIIAGIFSFLFHKDVNTQAVVSKKGVDYCEYIVK